MKLRYINLVILTTLFYVNNIYCQNCSDTCNWDWTDQSDINWKFVKSGGGEQDMFYFLSATYKNVPELDKIYENEDYTPENGWVLLHKNFGCEAGINYPYFILYNRYKSKIRLFVYLYDPDFANPNEGGMVTLRWHNDTEKTTSMLTHTNKISKANSYYHKGSYSVYDDIGTVFLEDEDDSWWPGYFCMADFNVAFDHLTPTEVSATVNPGDYELFFKLRTLEESNIELSGNFDFITQSYSGNISTGDIVDDPDSQDPDVKMYLNNAKKITKSIPSETDLKKIFDDTKQDVITYESNTNTTFGDTKISEKYKVSMENLATGNDGDKFMNFLMGTAKYAPAVSGAIDVALGVFDFFSDKSNKTTIQTVKIYPSISKGNLSMTGKISTGHNGLPITLELPGTPHYDPDQTPYYDCPLGLIGLEETPISNVKTVNLKVFEQPYCDEWCNHINATVFYREYKSVSIVNDLKIALNKSVNVEIKQLKAALYCESSSGILNREHWPHEPECCSTLGYMSINPILHNLNHGFYLLNSVNDSLAVYSTPFVDVVNFKNTSILCGVNSKVYIKLLAILETNDPNVSETPIVYVHSYEITENNVDYQTCSEPDLLYNYIYPFTRSQLEFVDISESEYLTTITQPWIFTGIYENWKLLTDGSVDVSPFGQVNFKGYNNIVLKPGFSAESSQGTFIASIENAGRVIDSEFTPINNIVTEYFEGMDCSCTVNQQKSANDNNYFNELIDEARLSAAKHYGPTVYPTPTNDIISIDNILIDESGYADFQIFNSNGMLIQKGVISNDHYNLSLFEYPSGLYLIKIGYGDQVKTFKIIKN